MLSREQANLLIFSLPSNPTESRANPRGTEKDLAKQQEIPTLAEAFMVPLAQPYIKKPLFGKRRLPLAAFLTVGGFLFETGAVLGYAFKDRQLAFEKVIGLPEAPGQLVRFMRLKAKERMAEGKSQDDSLALFVYKTHVARLGHPMNWSSIKEMERFTDWLSKQSLDLDAASSGLQILFYEGVGYGFEFPEDTQQTWKASYETRENILTWREAYQYGVVHIPEPPPIQTWDERVSELKDALKGYIAEFKPTLNTLFTE